jgi:hypothetical protein
MADKLPPTVNTSRSDQEDESSSGVRNTRPPPFNPDFIRSVEKGHNLTSQQDSRPSVPTPSVDDGKIEHVVLGEDNMNSPSSNIATNIEKSGQDQPPYNPEFIKSVASDISTTSSARPVIGEQTSTTDHDRGDFSPLNTNKRLGTSQASSLKTTLHSIKRMTLVGARRVQRFEQEHQVGARTKNAAVQSVKAVRDATVSVGQKAKEFNEEHQLGAKTKETVVKSFKAVKQATIYAGRQAQDFNDKHQVTAKTKQQVQRGLAYAKQQLNRD